MSYGIRSAGSVGRTVRRIAREQIERALREIDDFEMPRHEAVHQVRKRCKKLRALLRLARPALGDVYRGENSRFRDVAQGLAGARDSQIVVDAFEVLVEAEGADIAPSVVGSIRDRLADRRSQQEALQSASGCAPARCRGMLEQAWLSVEVWPLDEADVSDLVSGFERTYRQGRRRLKAARRVPSTEHLHDLRKAVKYHWYHLRLLRPAWREVLGAQARAARALAEHLGEDHDLAVLHDAVVLEPGLAGGEAAFCWLAQAIRRRREELLRTVLAEGALLYAEPPGALRRRLEGYRRACYGADR